MAADSLDSGGGDWSAGCGTSTSLDGGGCVPEMDLRSEDKKAARGVQITRVVG